MCIHQSLKWLGRLLVHNQAVQKIMVVVCVMSCTLSVNMLDSSVVNKYYINVTFHHWRHRLLYQLNSPGEVLGAAKGGLHSKWFFPQPNSALPSVPFVASCGEGCQEDISQQAKFEYQSQQQAFLASFMSSSLLRCTQDLER